MLTRKIPEASIIEANHYVGIDVKYCTKDILEREVISSL